MSEPDFDKSIFLNCPFDKEFEAILQAIIFAICYMGYRPRLALETQNSAELRLNKIRSMIEDCRFSIHDLSRSQAKRKGEYYRLNMPFELGLDYGCRHYMDGRQDKVILVLEEKPYRYQAALSDLAGCDIQAHGNEPEKAVRIVRNWLAHEARLAAPGPARILVILWRFPNLLLESSDGRRLFRRGHPGVPDGCPSCGYAGVDSQRTTPPLINPHLPHDRRSSWPRRPGVRSSSSVRIPT